MSDTRMLELVAKLDDADELVCLATLDMLGAMATSPENYDFMPAFDNLVKLTTHYNADIRERACLFLGFLGDERAIPYLLNRQHDERSKVKVAMITAVHEIVGSPSINYFAELLNDVDWRVREACVRIVVGAWSTSGYELSLIVKNDSSEEVRSAAVATLARNYNEQAFSLLVSALDDSSALVRRTVAEALGTMDNVPSTNYLLLALDDREESVRSAAAKALGELADVQALPALMEAQKKYLDYRTNASIREAIREISELSQLIAKLDDVDDLVCLRVLDRLGTMSTSSKNYDFMPAFDNLVKLTTHYNADIRERACLFLGFLGDERAVPYLLNRRHDERSKVKVAMITAVREIIGSPSINYFAELLDDVDWRVRQACVRSMVGVSSTDGFDKLSLIVRTDSSEEVRTVAVTMLARNYGEQAFPLLVSAFDDSSALVRRTVAEALGTMDNVPSTNYLLLALDDKEKSVRSAAAKALGELADVQALPALMEAQKRYMDYRTNASVGEAIRRISELSQQ